MLSWDGLGRGNMGRSKTFKRSVSTNKKDSKDSKEVKKVL